MAYHAEVQHAIADMAIELEAIGTHLNKVAQD
jgi:alkylation response protein AidB-like acyl-CoA dehydrogenase